MNADPLPPEALAENGLGAVSRRLIRERAAELALINGRPAHEINKSDWEQAKRELAGAATTPRHDFPALDCKNKG